MQASDGAAEAATPRTAEDAQLSDSDARFQRTMKIVVGVLGFLMVAALVAVVLRVIYLASRPSTQPAEQQTQSAPPVQPSATAPGIPADLSLKLPAGAVVRSLALSGDRLAVHYEAGGKAGIAVLDLKTGRTVSNVGIESGEAGK